MATPTEQDVTLYYKGHETISGTATAEGGGVLDLTAGGSVNLEFQIASEYGGSPVVSKSIAGTTLTGGTAGDYSLTIAGSDWTSLPLTGPKREWHYTIWHTDSSGTRVPKARGKLTVRGTVSS